MNKPSRTISLIQNNRIFIERDLAMAEKQPRTIGYFRVSREEQDLDKNRADILALANREDLGRVEFVEEKASGRIAWRKRRIADMLDELREGRCLDRQRALPARTPAFVSMRSRDPGGSTKPSRAGLSPWHSQWPPRSNAT
ncbi:MAG: recombinase family protein [Albidovulum sp.]|nr:recombinase family protein [Albidovulum sp.]